MKKQLEQERSIEVRKTELETNKYTRQNGNNCNTNE